MREKRRFHELSAVGSWGGHTLPNVARYQLRHTPMSEKYSIFRSISVSGQTCGQTAFTEDFAREQSAEKVSVYKGFRRFLFSRRVWSVSCSQTSRATNCATPRCVKNIRFLVNFRKWSNLWSKHFVGVFLKRVTAKKSMFARDFEHLKNQEAETACMLPKLVGDRYPTSRYSVLGLNP